MLYFKFLSVFLIVAGIVMTLFWYVPAPLSLTTLFTGSILGLAILAIEKRPMRLLVPICFWLVAFICYAVGYWTLDNSEGFESLNWLVYAAVAALVAMISTVYNLFKPTKNPKN